MDTSQVNSNQINSSQILDEFLDSNISDGEKDILIELAPGISDPRIKQLSYSSLLTLHNCPRKYQLYKLNAIEDSPMAGDQSSLTFAFGHAVGAGIQAAIENKTEEQIIWEMFKTWNIDFLECNPKQNKSFWSAVLAVQKFIAMKSGGFLNDYELVYHNGNPAVELGFCITFPDGFRYRGFVDVVLRHKFTGNVIVLELKTSSAVNLNAAMYKNSAQAIGYSIVLDAIFPDLSAYEVLYLIYQTKSYEYQPMQFVKSYVQRALWIRELVLDIEFIKLCEESEVYPMHGESCYNFYRECEYLNLCTMDTKRLTKPLTKQMLDKISDEVYHVNLTIADLIDAQLAKAEH